MQPDPTPSSPGTSQASTATPGSSSPSSSPAAPHPGFIRLTTRPLLFRAWLFSNIPSAFYSGLRVTKLNAEEASVTVPYKRFTRNPFHSTYFACLAMAAEMSTGVLAMSQIYKRTPKISMLVIGMETTFTKKATSPTTFTCSDGHAIAQAIQTAISTGEAQTVKTHSVGTNQQGEIIAEFFITWSFKAKKS